MKNISRFTLSTWKFTVEPHFVTEKELKQYQEGRLAKSQNIEERQRAKVIKELVMEDEYINLLRITYEQLTQSSFQSGQFQSTYYSCSW